jgi:hypothetical protein
VRDLERYSRNVRNENRASISTGTGEPSPNDGNDGDIQINTTSGGLKLYAKYKGQWYETGLTKVLNKPEKIKEIGIPTIIDKHSSGAALGQPQSQLVYPQGDGTKGGIQPRGYVAHRADTTSNDDGVISYQSFENDIASLAAKINEIIEKIQ